MAPLLSTLPDQDRRERELLDRLLGLYAEEREIYARVLELSRQQGDVVRRGAPMGEVRRILEAKKECLEVIGRLEMTERVSKVEWETGRAAWSASSQATLHTALHEVSGLIEEILLCEEKNDLYLIEQTRVM